MCYGAIISVRGLAFLSHCTVVPLKKLANDPFEPSLKLHKLQGTLEKFDAVRLTYEYRIVLILMIIDERIVLIDIGTHDDVY